MKNKNLKVQPIKKYNTPKYPSHLDKNPLEYPETLPYPFRAKVLHGLVLTGLFTSVPFAFGITPPDHELPKNTFTLKMTGLPHTPSAYGTGLPSKLDAKEARAAIFKIFKEEGLSLKKDYLYQQNGQIYQLDGYDEKHKIGFSWLTWENLNTDNFQQVWWGYSGRSYLYSMKYYLEEREDLSEKTEYFENKQKEIKAISDKKLKDEQQKLLDFEATAFILANDVAHSSPFLKAKAKEALQLSGEEQTKALEYVHYRHSLEKYTERYGDAYNAFIFHINNNIHTFETEDLKKYYKMAIQLSQFRDWMLSDKGKEDLKKSLESFAKNPDFDAFQNAIQSIDEEKFSFKELSNLAKQAKEDKVFVAPISSFDRRFQYHGYWRRPSMLSDEKMNEINESVKNIEDEAEKAKARKAAIETALDEIPNPRSQTLSELEKQVRQYIRWAKMQGQY